MNKQQLHELSSKLVKKFGDEILKESFDFYSNLTTLIESGEIVDMDIKNADMLETICKRKAILEYKNSAYPIVSETIIETDYVLNLMNESVASEKARRLGLKHKGFGWYADPKNEKNIYRSTGEKLVKATSTVTNSDIDGKGDRHKRRNPDEGSKSKKSEKGVDFEPKSKSGKSSDFKSKSNPDFDDVKTKFSEKHSTKFHKPVKTDDNLKDFNKSGIHITDVMRIDVVKYIYKFKLNGEDQIIELKKDEYSSERPIAVIIYNKLKEREFEKGKFISYEKTTGRRGMRKSYTGDTKGKKRHFEDDDELPSFLKKGKKKSEKKSSKTTETE